MTDERLRADALACWAAALDAARPARLVGARLARVSGWLELSARDGRVLGRHRGPVLLVGAGKAAAAMAAAATERLEHGGDGIVIVPYGAPRPDDAGVEVAFGAHPVPDGAGEPATARLLARVAAAERGTLVLALLSGGASALLVAPAAGLVLEDKQRVTAALLARGAEIGALNAVRKHCSRVKGGGLARAAAASAGLWALLLSDVVGDDPTVIASGPAAADPTTFADAAEVLARHLTPDEIPPRLAAHVARGVAGKAPETVKAGDPVLAGVRTVVVGGNRDAVDAAAAAARTRGYATEVLATPLAGDAARAGRALAARLRAASSDRPVAIVAGGETTVRAVPGALGGRSQHLALAAATVLAGTRAVLLAAGTDGVDGPTDAAGACVDGETVARARASGFDAEAALARTASHALLAATGDLVRTGPTGTNVADLVVGLRAAC